MPIGLEYIEWFARCGADTPLFEYCGVSTSDDPSIGAEGNRVLWKNHAPSMQDDVLTCFFTSSVFLSAALRMPRQRMTSGWIGYLLLSSQSM